MAEWVNSLVLLCCLSVLLRCTHHLFAFRVDQHTLWKALGSQLDKLDSRIRSLQPPDAERASERADARAEVDEKHPRVALMAAVLYPHFDELCAREKLKTSPHELSLMVASQLYRLSWPYVAHVDHPQFWPEHPFARAAGRSASHGDAV